MNRPEDKRFFPRAMIALQAHVRDGEKRFDVAVVDLSVYGISFHSEQALPVGSRVIVELDDSEEMRNNKLTAEILRCDLQSNVTPPQYVVAAKFIEVNDEYLMDSLALVHGKKS